MYLLKIIEIKLIILEMTLNKKISNKHDIDDLGCRR